MHNLHIKYLPFYNPKEVLFVFKKLITILIASVFLIAFSHKVHAFVQGEWNMNVIENISAKVKKVATTKYTDDFSDTWSFSADGQFAIDGMPLGT